MNDVNYTVTDRRSALSHSSNSEGGLRLDVLICMTKEKDDIHNIPYGKYHSRGQLVKLNNRSIIQ